MIVFDIFIIVFYIFAKLNDVTFNAFANTIIITVCAELLAYLIKSIYGYIKAKKKLKIIEENLEELKKYSDDIEKMLKEVGSWTDKDEEDDMK